MLEASKRAFKSSIVGTPQERNFPFPLDEGVRAFVSVPTLEATQGHISSQSPTDATRSWWHLYGS